MRVLTWNINGVRTLPQYHPWNTFKTHDEILNALNADIICFQEMKSSRPNLPAPVAIPPSYHSFFSFPITKSGYSGVAVYTRSATVVPVKAEEGLTGMLQPHPPLTADERISDPGSYPINMEARGDLSFDVQVHNEGELEDGEGEEGVNEGPEELLQPITCKLLDSEGRSLVIDLGLFVLINVYCPNDGTGSIARDVYKKAFHQLLSLRVDQLLKAGREVMVVGDINSCAAMIDHCEGELVLKKTGGSEDLFWQEREGRRWLRDWFVEHGGPMVDVVRKFWPGRKGMYTCWNTKISARASNYGTRIDYILVTPGLLPWIDAADIEPKIMGSDHCPVWVNFKDEIVTDTGATIKLSSVLGKGAGSEPPRLASKFWDEHSGKQRGLKEFFGKKRTKESSADKASSAAVSDDPLTINAPDSTSQPLAILPVSLVASSSKSPSVTPTSEPASSNHAAKQQASPSKRKIATGNNQLQKKQKVATRSDSNYMNDPRKLDKNVKKTGQTKLASFFEKPKGPKDTGSSSAASTSKQGKKEKSKSKAPASSQPSVVDIQDEAHEVLPPSSDVVDVDAPCIDVNDISTTDHDADYKLALLLSQEPPSPRSSPSQEKSSGKQAWSSLLTPIQAPKCIVHDELTKEWTVSKPGPNKGKKFFLCSRPVGPGYDKGRAERPREDVDPQWRCNFFKWSSDVKRDMMKKESHGIAG